LDLNNGTNENGPFVMGDQISFADFTVAGMIFWLRRAEGGDMPQWKGMSEWQGRRWARIWAEAEKF
jgi:glutathione S-transferase